MQASPPLVQSSRPLLSFFCVTGVVSTIKWGSKQRKMNGETTANIRVRAPAPCSLLPKQKDTYRDDEKESQNRSEY